MSSNKKKSISYTVPADSDDDDDDDGDRYDHRQFCNRKYKSGSSSRSHMNPMHQMNSMMNSMLMNPFGSFGRMPGFPNMNNIMGSFQVNSNDPNCHLYSSRTVMTMSSGPDGRPQVYHASQSTRTAPGGICETKKSVCDSRTGTKKLAIGHHIGERSHIMEREHNLHSGQQEERQEFINLDEDEADEFNREWEAKTRSSMNAIGYGQTRSRSRRQHEDIPAITDRYRTRPRFTARRHYPAITSTPSGEHSSKKKKKRSPTHEEDSDEEEDTGKKSAKLLKSSHTKKKPLN